MGSKKPGKLPAGTEEPGGGESGTGEGGSPDTGGDQAGAGERPEEGGDPDTGGGETDTPGGSGEGETPEENPVGDVPVFSESRKGKTVVAVTGRFIVFDKEGRAKAGTEDAVYLKSCPGFDVG